jgi:GTPase-associated system helical domain
MSEEFIDENFGRWIRSVTIDEDVDRLQVLRTASNAAAKDLAGRELSVVLAAYGRMQEEVSGWLGAHLRAADEAFVAEGKDELLSVLSAVAVMTRMLSSEEADSSLCALAVSSAEFSGMEAVLDELPQVAHSRLSEMGRAAREAEIEQVSSYLMKVPAQRKETNEEGQALGVGQAFSDIHALGQTVKKLASLIDASVRPALARQVALDEEVEMLWWVVSDADENGERWSGQGDLARAVKGAAELAERTRILPEPPSGSALLQKLLGKAGEKMVTLAEFAEESASQKIEALFGREHALLPIASACEAIVKFATDDDQDTWQRALQNQLNLDPKRKHSLSEGSLQLYRELQILRLKSE